MGKEVHVVRHAERIYGTEDITPQGIKHWEQFKALPYGYCFSITTCSSNCRLLTGRKPTVDARARLNQTATAEDVNEIDELAKTHPRGSAGVIFASEKFIRYMEPIGQQMASLVTETMGVLPQDAMAIVISHDAIMKAGKRVLEGKPIEVGELEQSYGEGFKVTEELHVEELRLTNEM